MAMIFVPWPRFVFDVRPNPGPTEEYPVSTDGDRSRCGLRAAETCSFATASTDVKRAFGAPYPGANVDAIGAIGSALRLSFDASVLFDFDRSALRPEAQAALTNAAAQIDWRRELPARLEPGATAHIQGSFAPIQHGDTVIVEYVPARGTMVRVNKGVAVSGAHHDLMLAFLDHWIGQQPLSQEIKHALLGSP